MESAPDLVRRPLSADDKNAQQDRCCKKRRHTRNVPVILQIVYKQYNGDDTAKLHGNQPHNIAVPAAAVDEYADHKHYIHNQNTGGEKEIHSPAAITENKVNGDSGQYAQQDQDKCFAAMSGFSDDSVSENKIAVQQPQGGNDAPPYLGIQDDIEHNQNGFDHQDTEQIDSGKKMVFSHEDPLIGVHIFQGIICFQYGSAKRTKMTYIQYFNITVTTFSHNAPHYFLLQR